MLLIWFVPSVLMMILFTPFRWDRWYVTLEPGWGLLQALGVAGITLGLSYTMARVPALRARP
jgi:hypothetical protein